MKRNRILKSDASPEARNRFAPSWESPLVQVAQSENISMEDDNLFVSLWDGWEEMFKDLPKLGTVLTITGNEGAVLGVFGEYPADSMATSRHSLLTFPQHFWNARAIHARTEEGFNLYSIEFQDMAGHVLHKVCLGPASDFQGFLSWVHFHQAIGANAYFFNSSTSREHTSKSAQTGVSFPIDRVATLMESCMEARIPLNATVYNRAAEHSAIFTPKAIDVRGDWMFISDGEHGLHLRPAGLQVLAQATQNSSFPAIELLLHEEGNPVASLTAFEHQPAWNLLVQNNLHNE